MLFSLPTWVDSYVIPKVSFARKYDYAVDLYDKILFPLHTCGWTKNNKNMILLYSVKWSRVSVVLFYFFIPMCTTKTWFYCTMYNNKIVFLLLAQHPQYQNNNHRHHKLDHHPKSINNHKANKQIQNTSPPKP